MSEQRQVMNHLLVHVFNKILRIEERMIHEEFHLNLSVTEMHTIQAIGKEGTPNMSEVADQLHITLGTLTTAINRLVDKGYVDRTRDKMDRRQVRVHLTDLGQKAYEIHETYHDRMIQEVLEELSEEEAQVLAGTLVKLSDFFSVPFDLSEPSGPKARALSKKQEESLP
ncbi:Transcriptional regulator of fatty acid biosynthesis FabT [Clostridiaceae bacterium JG1575]|nr:Transcriptional regulator of fatty acid biosynthesis FabT [Clostridiaceae bacterium JG1575]